MCSQTGVWEQGITSISREYTFRRDLMLVSPSSVERLAESQFYCSLGKSVM